MLSKCLFALQVCFLHNFVSGFLNENLNYTLKTNLSSVRLQIFFFFVSILLLFVADFSVH